MMKFIQNLFYVWKYLTYVYQNYPVDIIRYILVIANLLIKIYCGANHSVVVINGKFFGWGDGQLSPKQLNFSNVKKIACGIGHTLVITHSDELNILIKAYPTYKLSVPNINKILYSKEKYIISTTNGNFYTIKPSIQDFGLKFKRKLFPISEKIKQITHMHKSEYNAKIYFILTECGKLYFDQKNESVQILLTDIVMICGNNQIVWAVTSNKKVYKINHFGKTTEMVIPNLQSDIVSINCSETHCCMLTANGSVYKLKKKLVTKLPNANTISINCGDNYFICSTPFGLFSGGHNDLGQLGSGDSINHNRTTKIKF